MATLRRRWIVIAVTTLAGVAIAGLVCLLTTPTYQSRIQFYVTSTGGDGSSAAYQGALASQQRVQSYAQLVGSEDVAARVVDAAHVDMTPSALAGEAEAKADPKTVLLTISVTDTDAARAQELATGYGTVLPDVVRALETPARGQAPLAKLTVVNPATEPGAPVTPRIPETLLLGLALGLLAGLALALLRQATDRRVTGVAQLEELVDAPVVGSLPHRRSEDGEDGAEHVVPFREGHSPAAEAYRRMRTNLQFLDVDHPPRVFVVTSSLGTEGKSETSINLALSLAEAGHRVVVVEADLRRPRVVSYLTMPDRVGLTTVLTGHAEVDDVIQETRYEGMDLLACGPLPPNPSELLSSDAAARLLADLRARYDFVIIDSPPLLPVTDGALLAAVTDGALLVVRTGRTTSDQVRQAVDNLGKADARLLGTIAVADKPVRGKSGQYYESYYPSSSPSDAPRQPATAQP